MIVTCVNNNPHEKVIQRGTLTAPTNAKFLALDYMMYIDRSVPVSVTFSRDDCTGSSSRSVTCEFIYITYNTSIVLDILPSCIIVFIHSSIHHIQTAYSGTRW